MERFKRTCIKDLEILDNEILDKSEIDCENCCEYKWICDGEAFRPNCRSFIQK